jgi:MoxR-like ATPase
MINTENLCFISGPESCGKSFLVQKYLRTCSNYIKIVIDKSIETKSLIGDYIVSHSTDSQSDENSSSKLSFFEWKDGPLIECIREGKLLVLEQAESGNDEIKGFLKGFVRSKQVQVRGEVLTIGNGFGLLIIWRTQNKSRR